MVGRVPRVRGASIGQRRRSHSGPRGRLRRQRCGTAAFTGAATAAVENLTRHPARSLLATLGVIVGVASVLVMLAVANGTRLQIEAEVRRLGGNRLAVRPAQPRKGAAGEGIEAGRTLTLEDALAIRRHCPAVAKASPRVRTTARVEHGNRNVLADVSGVLPEYFPMRNLPVASGRTFDSREVTVRSRVCVLGATVAEELFRGRPRLGAQVLINGRPYRVLGVLVPRGGVDALWDEFVWVPVTTAMERIVRMRHVNRIDTESVDEARMAEAEKQIETLLRLRHQLKRGEKSDFSIRSMAEVQEVADESGRAMSYLLAGVAAISLVVSGIGIMNIMLVSVSERTREIGIRRAVGARRRDIVLQFLLESIVMCGLGASLGTAIGLGICALASEAQIWPIALTPAHFTAAAGVALAVGLVFGLYPAVRAGGLSPLEALRHT